jgi:hypothetical protein
MVFIPSPALRRIRQLVRLIRKHPDLSAKTRNRARHRPQQPSPAELLDLKLLDPKLPDPELFMDTSAERNAISERTDLDSRLRRTSRPVASNDECALVPWWSSRG